MSTFSQAITMAEAENGPLTSWDWVDRDSPQGALNAMNILAPHLKLIKNCGIEKLTGCWPHVQYKYLNGDLQEGYGDNTDATSKAILADGSTFNIESVAGKQTLNAATIYAYVHIDINGEKPPNQRGVDLFVFTITDKGFRPYVAASGSHYAYDCLSTTNTESFTARGHSCAAWVIYKGNMDYLHKTVSW